MADFTGRDPNFGAGVGQEPERPGASLLPEVAGTLAGQLLESPTVQPPFISMSRSSLAAQCDFKTFGYQTLANVLHRLRAATESFRDPLVRPVGTKGVRFQQDLRSPHLTVQFLDHLPQCFAFHLSQPNEILLFHNDTLGIEHRMESWRGANAQKVTEKLQFSRLFWLKTAEKSRPSHCAVGRPRVRTVI
jgi:hypothetical protein